MFAEYLGQVAPNECQFPSFHLQDPHVSTFSMPSLPVPTLVRIEAGSSIYHSDPASHRCKPSGTKDGDPLFSVAHPGRDITQTHTHTSPPPPSGKPGEEQKPAIHLGCPICTKPGITEILSTYSRETTSALLQGGLFLLLIQSTRLSTLAASFRFI